MRPLYGSSMGEISKEMLEKIIEAILFTAGGVVNLDQLRKAIPETTKEQLKEALHTLKQRYNDRGVVIKEVAGGFRFETDPTYARYIQRFKHGNSHRLSRAALETLAIIAYNQPITKAEIDTLRGVDSAGAIKGLLERDLIKVIGRKEVPGRPLLYATTQRFLEVFGLKDLHELPTLKELEDLVRHEEYS